jgi:hypothetical protein
MNLRVSTDRKTANLASPNGKTAKIPNAFGLAAGREFSCPGATSACEPICYAGKLERLFKGMRVVVTGNLETIQGMTANEAIAALNELITEFERQCEKWDADKLFRIHHDGDFFSLRYAGYWRRVMNEHPDVTFWAYTRSFHLVGMFADIPNFTLYLSVDEANLDAAIETYAANPWVKLAALGKTFEDAKSLLTAMGVKGVRCPELNGALPLISVDGGACKVCGLCVFGRGNVLFSVSKK